MPASIKLQQQYGDDIQVLFVECQGATPDQFEAFAWRQEWMGTQALWTDERPLPTKGTGLPECALLDIDGKVLMQGNPLGLKKQIEAALAEQVKKAKSGPADASPEAKKAWVAFGKGDYAGALELCAKSLPPDEGQKVVEELRARVNVRVKRAQWLLDNGYVAEAKKLLAELAAQVKVDPELSKSVADQHARLGDPTFAKEAEANAALMNLTERMSQEKPFDSSNVKKLESLALKFAGTKNGERAAHLAALSKVKQ